MVKCIDGNFSPEQWKVFEAYNIAVPIEGNPYNVRKELLTHNGKAYLLVEIVNPMIPNGVVDGEGNDFKFEPSWGVFRFTPMVETEIEIEELENAN